MKTKVVNWLTETAVVTSSGGFLAWYIWAKVAAWPWGAYHY